MTFKCTACGHKSETVTEFDLGTICDKCVDYHETTKLHVKENTMADEAYSVTTNK